MVDFPLEKSAKSPSTNPGFSKSPENDIFPGSARSARPLFLSHDLLPGYGLARQAEEDGWFHGDFMVISWWFHGMKGEKAVIHGDFMVTHRIKVMKIWFFWNYPS